MTRVLWALLFLSLSSWLEASVTAGWKIPIEHFASDYKTNEKIRKLEKPPGESAFFQPGDELWDLSKGLTYWVPSPLPDNEAPFQEPKKIKLDQPWYGEWLIWNARSGMVVACGSWNDIFAAQKLIRFDEAPITIRTRVELVTGGKDAVTVSLSGENGLEASAKENGLEVDVRGTNMGPPGLIDGEFFVSWPASEKDSRWEVSAGVTLKEGNRTKLARRGRGPSRCEVFATASREFSNGVKVSEARMIEGPDGVIVWPVVPEGDQKKGRIGDGLMVRSYRSQYELRSVAGLGEDIAKLPRIEAPVAYGEWARGRVIDLRRALQGQGAILKEPGAMVIFDPGSDRYTVAGTPEDHDACDELIRNRGLSCPIYGRDLWIESNPEAGGWGLTCRSGDIAQIARTSPGGNGPSFKIEPMIGDSGMIAKVRYDFDVFSGGVPAGKLKSSTEAELGKPKEIAGAAEDGKEEKVVLTVTEN